MNDPLPIAPMTVGTGLQNLCALGNFLCQVLLWLCLSKVPDCSSKGVARTLKGPPYEIHVGCGILSANNPSKPACFPQRFQQEPFLTSAILCPVSIFLLQSTGVGEKRAVHKKAFEI